MSNVHPSHADFSRRQEYSPRHNIPIVLGMSQCNHNSFPPAQTYDPTSASNFLDEFSQPHPQFVDLLETHSSGVRLSYPSLTTPTPSTQFSPQYPITTVLPSVYHHPPLSPSSLSRLVQPTLSLSNSSLDAGIPRCAVAGSLDPTTGIFYRTPEPPRLRTAQACEKCRKRKAKCSGEHPACQRCLIRGLTCIYAPEGRVRGSQKPRIRPLTIVPPRDSRSARRSKETPPSSNTSSSSSSSSPPSTASTSSLHPLVSVSDSEATTSSSALSVKQGLKALLGRPRRATISSSVLSPRPDSSESHGGPETGVKRGPGRPRKYQAITRVTSPTVSSPRLGQTSSIELSSPLSEAQKQQQAKVDINSNSSNATPPPTSSPLESVVAYPALVSNQRVLSPHAGSFGALDCTPFGVLEWDNTKVIQRSLIVDTNTDIQFPDKGISPASLVLGTLERNNADGHGRIGVNCSPPTTQPSPLVATILSTHTPASSTTPILSPSSSLSPSNSGERVYVPFGSSSLPSSSSLPLYQDSFAEESNANFGYSFGSYSVASTPYLQDVPPQADAMRPDDSIDIDVLGEYLDWTCPKDVKEHCEGGPVDMESLF